MSYATLAEARAEGVTTSVYGATEASDSRLQRLLDDASRYIDEATGWWFEPRTKTLGFDGDGTECLWMPAPIISLTSVSIDDTALALGDVLVYGTTSSQTELRAARLARRTSSVLREGRATWPKGRRNITVVGSFGYVLSNGTSPPPEIRDACIRLAARNIGLLGDAAAQAARAATTGIFRETTDGHSYERAGGTAGTAGAWRYAGATGDPEIDTTLARYRRASRARRL